VSYQRVLIKLSGGALAGERDFGFSRTAIEHIVEEVLSVTSLGIEVAIVVGGGNVFRGTIAKTWGIERAEGDHIGMLSTVVNSLMLRGAFKAKQNIEARVMTSIPMEAIAEPYIRLRAIHHMEKKYVIILAGGIGQPFVTTDYPAVQRALEVRAHAILVAKQDVDGVYTANPKEVSSAKLYKTLTYDDFLDKRLQVMDPSALMLAKDYDLPVHVFNFKRSGCMRDIVTGKQIGTLISSRVQTETMS
jgi:uridylate kinase